MDHRFRMIGMTRIAVVALVFGLTVGMAAQQSQTPPFRTETSLVTVDAVVVDDQGRPVTGLTQADFEVLDAGVPQTVEFFQATSDRRSGGALSVTQGSTAASPRAEAPSPVSTNVGVQAAATRTFVLLFDDLHLTREQGERARQALMRFVQQELADGDLVSLVVPGSALRWHARLPDGRDELLKIAASLQGRFQPEPSFERITDYEAYRIHVFQDEVVANMVDRRWANYRQFGREPANLATDRGFQPQERGSNVGVIKQDLAIRAADVYSRLMARNRVTLGAMQTMVQGLEAVRGRKSVLLFSAGLIEDQEQIDQRHVLDAARRANVAVYFIDIRGLETGSAFNTAQFGSPLDTRDVGFANAQVELEVQGSENLAIDSGGFSIRNANDLDAALGRVSRELSSYYLLGFQPAATGAPGTFRPLTVRVKRPGVTVRARKGYYVNGVAPARVSATRGVDALQQVTDSPYDLDTIPLRVATYAFGSPSPGKAQVSLAIEADLRAFAFQPQGGKLADVLEVRVAAAHLESSTVERYDGQVEMTFPTGTRFGEDAWHTEVREFTLAPGRYQARIAVRDRNSGRIGALTHAFDVPQVDGFRVTTPIVTDTIEAASPGSSRIPKPVLVARREFPAGARVFYQFSVLGATSGGRVLAGHEVRNAAGEVVKQHALEAIKPASDGSLIRLAGLAMQGLPAGPYQLRLRIVDETSQQVIERREPFTLLPPQRTP